MKSNMFLQVLETIFNHSILQLLAKTQFFTNIHKTLVQQLEDSVSNQLDVFLVQGNTCHKISNPSITISIFLRKLAISHPRKEQI
jgi:hypothetical protein